MGRSKLLRATLNVNFHIFFIFSVSFVEHIFFASNFNVDKSQSPQSVSNKYVFTEEKLSPRSTFNPGLVLIGFPTAGPKTRLGVKLSVYLLKTDHGVDYLSKCTL